MKDADAEVLKRDRYELVQRLEDWLEGPVLVLAFVWLVLLVVALRMSASEAPSAEPSFGTHNAVDEQERRVRSDALARPLLAWCGSELEHVARDTFAR